MATRIDPAPREWNLDSNLPILEMVNDAETSRPSSQRTKDSCWITILLMKYGKFAGKGNDSVTISVDQEALDEMEMNFPNEVKMIGPDFTVRNCMRKISELDLIGTDKLTKIVVHMSTSSCSDNDKVIGDEVLAKIGPQQQMNLLPVEVVDGDKLAMPIITAEDIDPTSSQQKVQICPPDNQDTKDESKIEAVFPPSEPLSGTSQGLSVTSSPSGSSVGGDSHDPYSQSVVETTTSHLNPAATRWYPQQQRVAPQTLPFPRLQFKPYEYAEKWLEALYLFLVERQSPHELKALEGRRFGLNDEIAFSFGRQTSLEVALSHLSSHFIVLRHENTPETLVCAATHECKGKKDEYIAAHPSENDPEVKAMKAMHAKLPRVPIRGKCLYYMLRKMAREFPSFSQTKLLELVRHVAFQRFFLIDCQVHYVGNLADVPPPRATKWLPKKQDFALQFMKRKHLEGKRVMVSEMFNAFHAIWEGIRADQLRKYGREENIPVQEAKRTKKPRFGDFVSPLREIKGLYLVCETIAQKTDWEWPPRDNKQSSDALYYEAFEDVEGFAPTAMPPMAPLQQFAHHHQPQPSSFVQRPADRLLQWQRIQAQSCPHIQPPAPWTTCQQPSFGTTFHPHLFHPGFPPVVAPVQCPPHIHHGLHVSTGIVADHGEIMGHFIMMRDNACAMGYDTKSGETIPDVNPMDDCYGLPPSLSMLPSERLMSPPPRSSRQYRPP